MQWIGKVFWDKEIKQISNTQVCSEEKHCLIVKSRNIKRELKYPLQDYKDSSRISSQYWKIIEKKRRLKKKPKQHMIVSQE